MKKLYRKRHHKSSPRRHGGVFLVLLSGLIMLMSVTRTAAQDARVTINMRNATLEQVLRRLATASPYRFFYQSDELSRISGVSVNVRNQPVSAVLAQILSGTGMGYDFADGQITIGPNKSASVKTYRVTGQVSEDNGKPLPGVTVRVKGLNVATSADREGRFSMNFTTDHSPVLVFTYIGFQTQEIMVDGDKNLQIKMVEDNTKVGEVVVTGMFTRPKESYTGAATTISREELERNYSRNVLQTISALEPSMRTMADNLHGNDPNFIQNYEIRGASTMMSLEDLASNTRGTVNLPLFILDNFEISLERVYDLDPSEIESITVLKDAMATSTYGSRGANGVVVIESRKPEAGKLKVIYRGTVKLELADLSSYDLMSAAEKLELEKELGYWEGKPDLYEEYLEKVLEGRNTDWIKMPVRNGTGHSHSVILMGGESYVRYGVNFNYNKISGVMKGSDREVMNGGLNLSYQKDNLMIKNQLSVAYGQYSDSPYGQFSEYVNMNRYFDPYDEEGKPVYEYYHPASPNGIVYSPLYDAVLNVWNKTDYTTIRNTTQVSYNVLQGLWLRGSFAISRNIKFSDLYYPPSHHNYFYTDFERSGRRTRTETTDNQWQSTVQADYNKTFDEKHLLTLNAMAEIEQSRAVNTQWSAEGFINDKLDAMSMAMNYPLNTGPTGATRHERRVGLTGAVNYYYDMRYFLDANIRMDGSSSFGEEKRYAPFYAVGAGWTVSNEAFFKDNISFINYLQFRYAYGVSGSLNFSPEEAMTIYTLITSADYLGRVGSTIRKFGNPALQWQNTYQHNFSANISFFNDVAQFFFSYYSKDTKKSVSEMDLPISHGYESYKSNVGTLRNIGFEYGATFNVIRDPSRQLYLTMRTRFSRNINRLVKISEAMKTLTESNNKRRANDQIYYRIKEGESIDALYGAITAGIDPVTGNRLYYNKDGQLVYYYDWDDEVVLGDRQPKINGNIGFDFRWKGFTLNMNFLVSIGSHAFNQTYLQKLENPMMQNNLDRKLLTEKKWKEPGDIAKYKRYTSNTSTTAVSTFIQKNNFFQMSAINVKYQLPDNIVHRMKLERISVGVGLSDIFYASTIKRERGMYYPFTRNPNFEISFTF